MIYEERGATVRKSKVIGREAELRGGGEAGRRSGAEGEAGPRDAIVNRE